MKWMSKKFRDAKFSLFTSALENTRWVQNQTTMFTGDGGGAAALAPSAAV